MGEFSISYKVTYIVFALDPSFNIYCISECDVQNLNLVACSEQDGHFVCSVTLLVNQELVTSLKLTQDGVQEVVQWFALGNLASSLPLFVSDASFSQVQKCKDFIFSMFASGPLSIL